MSFQFHASCECGFKSDVLFGNTCVCRNCKNLVDARTLPFRYELSPCPKCALSLFEEDTLSGMLGEGWLVTGKPSSLTCPVCDCAKVEFHLGAHLSVAHGIKFPKVGDEIDGCIKKNGKLDIPWFTLDAADIQHDIPSTIEPGQRITMRVTSISTASPTDLVQSMFYRKVVTKLGLQYLNTLPLPAKPR